MCGIAGAAWNLGLSSAAATNSVTPAQLVRMSDAIAHRGPDDAGYLLDELTTPPAARLSTWGRDEAPPSFDPLPERGVALAHRRLSIIGLSDGHQPLCNEDRTIWVVFNGEIYNYRALRETLLARGHRFRTQTDTEVLVHAYEEYGLDFLQQLRGMFAFALWDAPARTLLLARDRIGKKPLVYRRAPGSLSFASELKALLTLPGIERRVHLPALHNYLALQYVPAPESILAGFAKLPPGHAALYQPERDELRLIRYWRSPYEWDQSVAGLDLPAVPGPRDERGWQDVVRRELTEATRLRLRSDVPLGAFLSGGIDSTIIAGLMQQEAGQRIKTFAIGFPVARFDETSFAELAARHLGTEHHTHQVDPQALELLPELVRQYDEPFADSSAIPTMILSRWTRQHVTVALTGDGGDELFAGYDRYRAVALASRLDRLPLWFRKLLAGRWWQLWPRSVVQRSKRRRLARFAELLAVPHARRYANWVSIFDDARLNELLSDDLKAQLQGHDALAPLLDSFAACREPDRVQQTSAVDVETYLPNDILTKVDLASMRYALECRSPFLDHRVVEVAARCPAALKLRGGRGKHVLIEAFRDLLPREIRHRAKMGFGVPLDHWFRGPLRPLLNDTLLSQRALARGYFRETSVRRLVEDHQLHRWDHSARLWSLLMLELWCREYLDPTAP